MRQGCSRILTLAILVVIGCRPESQPTRTAGPPGSADNFVANQAQEPLKQGAEVADADSGAKKGPQQDRAAEIPLASLGIDRESATGDAADIAWQMEAHSEQIQSQLNQWMVNLEQSGGLPASEMWPGIVSAVECSELRPASMVTVFEDGKLSVRRGEAPLHESAPSSVRVSPPEMMVRFDAFRDPLSGADEIHAKAKISSIHRNGDRLATRVHVTLSGHDAKERRQQTTIWNCEWLSKEGKYELTRLSLDDFEEVVVAEAETFRDATLAILGGAESFQKQIAAGVDYWLDRLEDQFGAIPAGYHGLAVGDVNGDGLDDLFVPQLGGVLSGLPNRLFLQNEDGTMKDISSAAGIDWTAETHSGLIIDLDNDGDQDLVVATVFGLVFCENDGKAHFTRRVVQLTPEAPPMSLAAADYDQDGDLDIYTCCYSQRASSPLMGRPVPYHDANNGGRNMLLRNDRDWRFRDVTQKLGLDQNNHRYSFAASWEDYDNDGDLDLYVANDYGRNNLYRNDDQHFRDVAAEVGVEDISAGMSVVWGDYNRDGWMDIYVSNMWSSAGNRIAYQRNFHDDADPTTRSTFQRHARGNSLFVNRLGNGQNRFEDQSVEAGVTLGRWAWSSQFADVNNDGLEDIYVANGFITQEDTGDL